MMKMKLCSMLSLTLLTGCTETETQRYDRRMKETTEFLREQGYAMTYSSPVRWMTPEEQKQRQDWMNKHPNQPFIGYKRNSVDESRTKMRLSLTPIKPDGELDWEANTSISRSKSSPTPPAEAEWSDLTPEPPKQ